jgi:hypothetical protein
MSNTTTQAHTVAAEAVPSPTATVGQARTAWATASRDTELYALAVPLTAMTTWERHEAGFPPRDAGERARYRELDQCSARRGAEMEAGR